MPVVDGVRSRPEVVFVEAGKCFGQKSKTDRRPFLNGYAVPGQLRHVRPYGEPNNPVGASERMRWFHVMLEVEAAVDCLLSKAHIRQLHRRPHPSAVDLNVIEVRIKPERLPQPAGLSGRV